MECALVVYAYVCGGSSHHELQFNDKTKFKHDLLLMMEDAKPTCEHWTLKTVWNLTKSVALSEKEMLGDSDEYVCLIQEEDNMDVSQLKECVSTMIHHYMATREAVLTFLCELHPINDRPHLTACIETDVATMWKMGRSDGVTVFSKHVGVPKQISIVSFRYDPPCTTVAWISVCKEFAVPDDIRSTRTFGRCYQQKISLGASGRKMHMFESYDGPMLIMSDKSLVYDGDGCRMCIASEWYTQTQSGVVIPHRMYTSINGAFKDGRPHGTVKIEIAWCDGRGYTFIGTAHNGRTLQMPAPTILHKCPILSHNAKMDVLDHRDKISKFAVDSRRCWCNPVAHAFNLNEHLRCVYLDCRPLSDHFL
jgi:hypothetical protein